MTLLLDGNVLVALAIETHEFHGRVRQWFDAQTESFATCSVTEGTLLRLYLRFSAQPEAQTALEVLRMMRALSNHEFWDAGFSYSEVPINAITGWKDVTDAWLAELARRKQGRLATLDEGLAARYPDVAFLVPH